jgi:aspartyl-tRNA(Asn)/glutamyl-tRNA(Gln) amidotransferase subunit B
MRSKEEAHDYRYFPDPDLPPLRISREWVNDLRLSMPEMPEQARERIMDQFGLSAYDAGLLTLSPDLLAFFDECTHYYHDGKIIANWMMGEMSKLLNQKNLDIGQCRIRPAHMAEMLNLIDQGRISGKMAKEVFQVMFDTGSSPEAIIKERGMEQISDEATLEKIILEVIANNPGAVEDYRNGKKKATGFLVGQVMQATRGQANPALVNQILARKLNS